MQLACENGSPFFLVHHLKTLGVAATSEKVGLGGDASYSYLCLSFAPGSAWRENTLHIRLLLKTCPAVVVLVLVFLFFYNPTSHV